MVAAHEHPRMFRSAESASAESAGFPAAVWPHSILSLCPAVLECMRPCVSASQAATFVWAVEICKVLMAKHGTMLHVLLLLL